MLVERIINKVINDGIDIDKLLIVTFTNAAASISACVGAAQNPLASDPDALTSPATYAAAFAKLPPPLWFMSPHASSAQSITYSTSAFSIPALRTA